MNVYELFAKISLDTNEYERQLNTAGEKTSRFGDKVKAGFGTIAKVGGAAIVAIGTAFVAATKKSYELYSNYEQLVGGVETLFGTGGQSLEEYAASVGKSVDEVKDKYNALMSAQSAVMDNAANAYKTAGLSANEYMETVTSFSASLLQGLGGDTEAAAKIADQAIIDMSDNANKMGTGIEMIQNAYQGFAKQNYTMLDNLKLGYGGTASEMARLINDSGVLGDTVKVTANTVNEVSFDKMIEAIHVVQTNMGITGTTAKEAATTIQGSVASMKAAWENFLTGMGDSSADLDKLTNNVVDSFVTAANNVVPALLRIMPKLAKGITTLAKKLIPTISKMAKDLLTTLVDSLLDGAPAIIEAAFDLLSNIVSAIPDVCRQLITAAPQIVFSIAKGMLNAAGSLVNAVQDLFNPLVAAANDNLERLEAIGENMTGWAEKVRNTMAQTVDFSHMVDKNGKTLADLESIISEKEDQITQTLATALSSQEGLRQQDIDNIRNYQAEMESAYEEQLQFYQSQLDAMATKVEIGGANMTYDQAAQIIADTQSLQAEALSKLDEAYTSLITATENKYAALGQVGSEAYYAELERNKAWYDEQYNIITSGGAKVNEAMGLVTQDWVETYSNGFDEINKVFDSFNEHQDSRIKNTIGSQIFYQDEVEKMTQKVSDLMEGMDWNAVSAFLSMQNAIVEAGDTMTPEAQKLASSILDAFAKMPPEMEESGKDILLGLVEGMGDVKGLENASEMSASTIVDTIKKDLLISSPSRVMASVGENVVQGMINGINNRTGALYATVRRMAYQVAIEAENALQVDSPSKVFARIGGYMAEGMGVGWKDRFGKVKSGIVDSLAFDYSTTAKTAKPLSAVNASIPTASGEQTINLVVELDGDIVAQKITKIQNGLARSYGRGLVMG